jgi:hypothetical protein
LSFDDGKPFEVLTNRHFLDQKFVAKNRDSASPLFPSLISVDLGLLCGRLMFRMNIVLLSGAIEAK